MWHLDSYPLAEEIGDPDLFVGREKEMTRLLKWAEGTKRLRSKSMGILSRRKMGKTALLQRFFNILYTRNDPQLIPFYYRIPDVFQTRSDFTEAFYRRTLTQYFAFTARKPEWVASLFTMDELRELAGSDRQIADDVRRMEDALESIPTSSWILAQEAAHRISQWKDVRIIQILDEFQYMNKYVTSDADPDRVELLCHSYMGAAESKFSPQIVAGSYIGWLEAILGHLTARHRVWHLKGLTDAEALEAVYNYAYTSQVAITDETAPYIVEVCDNDPFYIAETVSNDPEEKDLTTADGVRDALTYETVLGQGEIARIWNEYLQDAIERVNDRNARRMILYLAKHEPEERTRRQIRDDLSLEMTEAELEKRLKQLVMSDILARGSSNFHYRGLGDRVFAMVFRRIYGSEIDLVSVEQIDEDFKRELKSLKGELSVYRGELAEHRVRYRLLVASLRGATLADVVRNRPLGGTRKHGEDATAIGPFTGIRKARFYVDHGRRAGGALQHDRRAGGALQHDRRAGGALQHDRSVEVDLHAVHEDDDGTDLMIEVKDWKKEPSLGVVRRFVEVKEALEGQLKRKTVFLFYSESGLSEKAATRLREAGILLLDGELLAGFEASGGL